MRKNFFLAATASFLFGLVCLVLVWLLPPSPLRPLHAVKIPPADIAPAHIVSPPKSLQSSPPPDDAVDVLFALKKGQNFIAALQKQKVSYAEAHQWAEAISQVFDLRKLRPRDKIALTYGTYEAGDVALQAVTIILSASLSIEALRADDGSLHAARQQAVLLRHYRYVSATIETSLYEAALDARMPLSVLQAMVRLYSFDVDFQRDIHRGNRFAVLYESLHKVNGGEAVGVGNILSARLLVGGNKQAESLEFFRFEDALGEVGYYSAAGKSAAKALMKNPIDGARLSSGYGYRKHPILGYSKLHKGLDFAAPIGTAIYAAGNGVVEYAGRNGGYGVYVRIRHNGSYKTAYGHMSRLSKLAGKGRRVRQGDIIGYVGSTGRSTGPHLHYEVLRDGKAIDPRRLQLPSGRQLSQDELQMFHKQRKDWLAIANGLKSKNQASQRDRLQNRDDNVVSIQ